MCRGYFGYPIQVKSRPGSGLKWECLAGSYGLLRADTLAGMRLLIRQTCGVGRKPCSAKGK